MKYLKKYETIFKTSKYQKDDLVLIDSDWLESIAKIIDVISSDDFKKEIKYKLECKIKLSFDMKNEFTTIFATEDEIIRKLTPSEIIEYNLRNDVKKYNI